MNDATETAIFLRRYQSWRKGEIDVFYPDSHAGPNPVEISAAIDRAIAALEAQPPCGADGAVTFALDYYDAGLLGDGGGGNVEWWQDYMRSELSRAHDCYQSQIDANHQPAAPVARSLSESFDKVMAMQDPKDIPDDAITLESCDRARRLMTDLGYATDDSRDPLAQDFKTRLIAKHLMRAMEAAPVAPATVAVPVPDGVVVAFGLLWHVRMGCDFPVPEGFSRNISPEEAAAKARRFLAGLLTREQRGEGINRAAAILSTTATEGRKDE